MTDEQVKAVARLERALMRVADQVADADADVRRALRSVVAVVVPRLSGAVARAKEGK